MRSAFGAGECVDFVDNDCADGREDATAPRGGQQDVERFRRGDEDLWSVADHPLARRWRRVAGPDGDADFREMLLRGMKSFAQLAERAEEVALDIVAEGFERRDVENVDGVGERRA